MYNAEKYVGECLESVLAQTFTNFEVIVVDDCSTDNSVAIVESYEEKFGGRLILSCTEKNSGSGAIARNKGLRFSRGEYIFNMDNDDILTKTALEELYTLAKNFDADVIYCEKYFMSTGTGQDFKKNIHLADSRIQRPPYVDEPTFEPEDLSQRIKNILSGKFWPAPWLKLVRRSLIVENNFLFPPLTISDDIIWTYGLIFFAKKFLHVPNMVYIRRMSETSITGNKKTPQQTINFWLNPVLLGLKTLDDLMSRHEFFQTNLEYRYAILENFINAMFSCILQASFQLPASSVYETIKKNFCEKLGDNGVLICALCTVLTTKQKLLMDNSRNFNQFAAQTQRRIAELERTNRENKAYIVELEKLIIESNRKEG